MLTTELGLAEWTAATAVIAGGMALLAVLLRTLVARAALNEMRPVDVRGERIHRPQVFWQTWIVLCDTFACFRRRLQQLPPPSISRR